MKARLLLASVALLAAGAHAAPGPGMSWAQAFAAAAAPADVHFKASYRGSDGAPHVLESWRVGTALLHRRTDQDLDLFVSADPASVGHYHYRLVDHRRKAVIDVGRTNLFRIGVFTDWDGLAHAITAPRGAVQIEALGQDVGPGGQPCEWRWVQPGGSHGKAEAGSDICWSPAWGLPLRIRDHAAAGTSADTPAPADSFQVVLVERLPEPHALSVPPGVPAGYDYIDADADIDPASD